MIIDCQTCPVRGTHCADCMVPVVARQWLADPGVGPRHDVGRDRRWPRAPGGAMSGADRDAVHQNAGNQDDVELAEGELDDAEWEAVDVFVRAGMINTLVAAGTTATVTARGAWSRVG